MWTAIAATTTLVQKVSDRSRSWERNNKVTYRGSVTSFEWKSMWVKNKRLTSVCIYCHKLITYLLERDIQLCLFGGWKSAEKIKFLSLEFVNSEFSSCRLKLGIGKVLNFRKIGQPFQVWTWLPIYAKTFQNCNVDSCPGKIHLIFSFWFIKNSVVCKSSFVFQPVQTWKQQNIRNIAPSNFDNHTL